MINNKRGISDLVATVLIVLITIAAVGMIWGAIMPIIKKNIDTSQQCNDANIDINTQQGFTYDMGGGNISIQVSRGPSTIDLSGIQIKVIDLGGNSNALTQGNVPSQNADKVYIINITKDLSLRNVSRIGIAAIMKIGNTNYTCPIKEIDMP